MYDFLGKLRALSAFCALCAFILSSVNVDKGRWVCTKVKQTIVTTLTSLKLRLVNVVSIKTLNG